MKPALPCFSLILTTMMAGLLAGCGAAAGGDDEVQLPPGDSASFLPLVEYCGARTPTAADAATNGWSQERPMHTGNPTYYSHAVVSAGGNTETSTGPFAMNVSIEDYRGIEGSVVSSGAADAATGMGVRMSSALGRNSVACVSQVARLRYTTPAWLPGTTPGYNLPQLTWTSYWQPALPMAQAGGYHVDGFEFVSNFTPTGGSVVFTIAKSRFPSTQALSLCHLAPAGTSWDCRQPAVADAGNYWRLSQDGLQQGVYLLNSSAPR